MRETREQYKNGSKNGRFAEEKASGFEDLAAKCRNAPANHFMFQKLMVQ